MGVDVPYRRLRERTAELGRHFGKYLLILDRHLPALVERLEQRRMRERMELWRPATEPALGFGLIGEIAADPDEAVRMGRAYYAVQFLLLDVAELDALSLALASDAERFEAYGAFLTTLRRRFVRLSVAYLQFLAATLAPAARDVRWALVGVGTLKDQDDIDVAMIDDGSPARTVYTGEVARVVAEMWKSATPLHFYLAEQMGARAWSYPLEAYEKLTDTCLDQHVVQSEIVNSTYLLGDRDLADAFQQRVARRYFFGSGADPVYHEAFLRGMVGEVRSLLFDQLADDRIHPKNDGLRIIKALAHALRTILGLESRDPGRLLDQAAAARPHLSGALVTLKRSLAYIETVHTLFQILHAHDEEIPVDAGGPLDRVATTMGYRPLGALSPRDQLLVEYYRQVTEAHAAARPVVHEIKDHLRQVSRVHRVLDGTEPPGASRAAALVCAFARTPGNCYWYDVIERLGQAGQPFLADVAADFARETPEGQAELERGYVTWGRQNVFAWLHWNRLLHDVGTPEAEAMRHRLDLAWLGAGVTSDVQTRLANLFRQEPQLFHRFLSVLQADEMAAFSALVGDPRMVSERTRRGLAGMARVAEAYQGTSRAFSRNLRAVADAHPAYLDRLGDPDFLAGIGHGLIGLVPLLDDIARRKEHLVMFYRVQVLRSGLLLLANRPLDEINRVYTDFSDLFFRSLYRLARHEAEREAGGRVETRDRTAIFTTGGRGREEAFDDDLDMIVVADHLSDEGMAFLSRIVARMNNLLTRLGLFPHYRMADHFGAFVTPLPQIEAHLRSDQPDIFLDMTEILELRLVEGSLRSEDRIRRHLIHDILFTLRRDYLLNALRGELASRREHYAATPEPDALNVKEHPGGLREIELALLYSKVLHRLDWPVRLDLFERLAGHDARHAATFHELHGHFVFLKRLRHLNRVLVATSDVLQPQTADHLARWAPAASGDALLAEARDRMRRAGDLVSLVVGA